MGPISRRHFQALVARTALASALPNRESLAAIATIVEPEQMLFKPNGWMPNNAQLPCLLYRQCMATVGDTALHMETLFNANGWPPQWRNGVYPFHHYHSTAHELLGFARGEALLVVGGPSDGPLPGRRMAVHAGDVLLLPAGTGHCELSCSPDFLVIGAYPEGQHWDVCRTAPDEPARRRMADLPFPPSDPVGGAAGAMVRLWKMS